MNLETYYQSIARYILNQTINLVVITNKGKRNLYVYKQIQCMKDRFHEKYRTLMYDEDTLDPLDKVIDNMITVKLEEDMYENYISLLLKYIFNRRILFLETSSDTFYRKHYGNLMMKVLSNPCPMPLSHIARR